MIINKLAAVCIIENNNNEILLLNRNYRPYGWGLVGGKIEKNESIIDGLCREIYEEIGFDIDIDSLKFIKKDLSINGLEINIFKYKLNKDIDIILSPEHSDYTFTNKFEDISLAGNTLSFIS